MRDASQDEGDHPEEVAQVDGIDRESDRPILATSKTTANTAGVASRLHRLPVISPAPRPTAKATAIETKAWPVVIEPRVSARRR